MVELREGTYRFASKVRGQADLILEEMIDPDGECVLSLADVEGDAGALALAMPLDIITFETWLFGQVGDQETLDLKLDSHWQLWFNFGAWIGETLRRRHGGSWLTMTDDPKTWRLGFSRIALEIAPFAFAENLLLMGPGAAQRFIGEVERLRMMHEEQREKDGGQDIDRFGADYYVRLHTIPLGQWFVLDFKALARIWNNSPARVLVKEIKKQGKRLGPANQPVIQGLLEAVGKANQDMPIAQQKPDRAMFEAVAQIVALRRTSSPVAIDIIEKYVLPAMHIGLPDRFPPLDSDDLALLRKGMELFPFFVEVVPHKYQADEDGFLGMIPNENLSSPYGDQREVQFGRDWVIIDPKQFKQMLLEFDTKRMLETYDRFVKYVRSNPKAPRRRDNNRHLAEEVARALADLRAAIVASSKDGNRLLFRVLPPPA